MSSSSPNILISSLPPPSSSSSNSSPSPVSFSIKLNNDLIHLLKSHTTPSNKIKLIVKNGNISIKLSDSLIFPCLPLPENLTVDVYSLGNNTHQQTSQYDGRIINKLTVVTDSKKIKEINAANAASATNSNKSASSRLTPFSLVPSSPGPGPRGSVYSTYSKSHENPYKVSLHDSHSTIGKKLLHLLALGPISYHHICELMDYLKIDNLLDDYGQVYNENDQFIREDKFPYTTSAGDSLTQLFILKDKSYKELMPWKWNYDNYERNLILNNVNNALTRIGFSQSHPLRRKIVEPSDDNEEVNKKPNGSSLGGGFLISSSSSKKKSTPTPMASKANTPVIPSKSSNNNGNTTPSPQVKTKPTNKRKFSSSSSSSEDDDSKKMNYTSPPSSEEETHNSPPHSTGSSGTTQKTKLEYYTNLANKFRNKYKEYSDLYNLLLTKNDMKSMDYKENVTKLFKMHQSLSDWKRSLWNFDKESKLKSSLSELHIERNSPVPPVRVSSPPPHHAVTSNGLIDAHPPGIRSTTPFKRRKVMDY
ncbi:hypothetical protein Cantr_05061 [Candida viswanathii]|uniref:RNA polymerase II elongation factor ELL N-terminal domain-containing protein n=1 Tax=Candida viswanathii TaxID=5486 RepID=A0A367XQX5_9ASCO|nr:hypothetical protein Cantr_05061 [Candida viswanathii]